VLVTAGILPGSLAAAMAFRHVAFDTPLDVTPRPGETVTPAVTRFQETGQNVYVSDATALADGKRLYTEWCEACHLADGSGRIGASLVAPQHIYPRTATDVGLFEAVFGGALGAMRPFNDKMTQDQILRVTAYVRSLQTGGS
jgi:cytochrome c-L